MNIKKVSANVKILELAESKCKGWSFFDLAGKVGVKVENFSNWRERVYRQKSNNPT